MTSQLIRIIIIAVMLPIVIAQLQVCFPGRGLIGSLTVPISNRTYFLFFYLLLIYSLRHREYLINGICKPLS